MMNVNVPVSIMRLRSVFTNGFVGSSFVQMWSNPPNGRLTEAVRH